MDFVLIIYFIWVFFEVVFSYGNESMTTLKCPNCEHKFDVDCNENGLCPGCGKMEYDWDYLIDNGNDELDWTGFHWYKTEE